MRTPLLRFEIDRVVSDQWPAECITFSGRQQPNGYGRVSVDGTYRRSHVYACERAHGPCPPDKREVAHSCGNRMCINPSHLRWATRRENLADHITHGTTNRAERAASARLSWADVFSIRRRYAGGDVTQRALANEYEVHLMTINDVVNHRTWLEPF